jgi:hypothetical protein
MIKSETMTHQEISEIKKRADLATRGPWKFYLEGRDHTSGDSFIMTGIAEGEDIRSKNRGEDIYLTGATNADQDFIANARQDIPNLLEEISSLKRQIEALNKNA